MAQTNSDIEYIADVEDDSNTVTLTINYFKDEAINTGIPYQTLINLYLTDCAEKKKKLQIHWGE